VAGKRSLGCIRPADVKIKDRHENDFCFDDMKRLLPILRRREIRSSANYRSTCINQTKFRDEVRPRFGVMRAREFVMKDAILSMQIIPVWNNLPFHAYTYSQIFTRLGLKFRAVSADTGAIGRQRFAMSLRTGRCR